MSSADRLFDAFMGAEALSDEMGEPVRFIPHGVIQNAIELHGVIINRDSFPGTNEAPGDGRLLNRPTERSERKSIVIDIPAHYNIPETIDRPNSPEEPHLVVIDGDGLFTFKKLMSRDESFDTYLVAKKDISGWRDASRYG